MKIPKGSRPPCQTHHSDMKTTQRYSHLNDKSLRETVRKLENR